MLCTGITSRRSAGFTFVEVMVVISIVSIVLALSGSVLRDQMREQKVASALQQARDIATLVEPVRDIIRQDFPTTFGLNPYKKSLTNFLSDLTVEPSVKSQILGGVSTSEDVLGTSSGSAYEVVLSQRATFVVLKIDDKYADIDFNYAAKPDSTKAEWIVPSSDVSSLVDAYLYFNEINK